MCTHLRHASLGTPESTPQMASQSVQSLLHSSRQRVAILYNGLPFPPSKLPLPTGDLRPHLIHIPWAHRSPQPKWYLDRFSHLCRAHDCDEQTDRTTRSVTIGHIYVHSTEMQPNNTIKISAHCKLSTNTTTSLIAICPG